MFGILLTLSLTFNGAAVDVDVCTFRGEGVAFGSPVGLVGEATTSGVVLSSCRIATRYEERRSESE